MIFNFKGQERQAQIVRLYGRAFVVVTDLDGTARSIKERKRRADGTVRDETYWHWSQPIPGIGRLESTSVVRSVLDAAGANYRHLERLAA